MPDDYVDLEICISQHQNNNYSIKLELLNDSRRFKGYIGNNQLLEDILRSPPSKKIGEDLFKLLFVDSGLAGAWRSIRSEYPSCRVRFFIDIDKPCRLYDIPWELFRAPDKDGEVQDLAASVSTPFSRYVAGPWSPVTSIVKRPIKILVVISNPCDLEDKYGLSHIDVNTQLAALRTSVKDLGGIEIIHLPGLCTLSNVERSLEGVHILHFIGHSKYNTKSGRGVLYMSDEFNKVQLVTYEELTSMLGSPEKIVIRLRRHCKHGQNTTARRYDFLAS